MGSAVANRVLDGVLPLDKPEGWTSHDVVAKLRGLFRGAKVGHAGTLDPAATGLLPVLIGQGTRIAEYLVEWDKEYRAVLRLGTTTDTQDATGTVMLRRPVPVFTREQLEEVARRFTGPISQIPPMYSAVKVAGVPLYRSARAGKDVDRQPRTVTIHQLTVLDMHGDDVVLHVQCSKGTYIRTLCADMGEVLGCGAHLASLCRTRVGPLRLGQAVTVDEVGRQWEAGTLGESLVSLNQALSDLPAVRVDEATASRVMHGVAVPWSSAGTASVLQEGAGASHVRIHDAKGQLLAIGSLAGSEGIRIRKVLVGHVSGRAY